MNYYGQKGEDILIDRILGNKPHGYFVEIGCIDGRVFSNTLSFEERGWKGICVEAHNDYIAMLVKNRPGSIVVHCAIGEKDEDDVTFYSNARGSLSSLDKNTEARWLKDYKPYFHGFVEQKVAKKTLTTVFNECSAPYIDFMSLDIEGYEVEALAGLDFTRYKPHIILVEWDSEEHKRKINAILEPNGYTLILEYGSNLFYSIDPRDEEKLKDIYLPDVEIVRAGHPIDGNEDQRVKFNIDTRRKKTIAPVKLTTWQKLRNRFSSRDSK